MALAMMSDDEYREAAASALAKARERDAKDIRQPLDDAGWYIVRRAGKSDRMAIDGFRTCGIEVYYPQVLQLRSVPKRELPLSQRRSGIIVRRPRLGPLFPGYYFAKWGMSTREWRDICRIAGIGGMLCNGGMPMRVDDDMIERIRDRERDGSVPGQETFRTIFRVGDRVSVTDGPFAGFEATVERGLDCPVEDLDPDTRIKVAISIFGRETPLDLSIEQVTKLD